MPKEKQREAVALVEKAGIGPVKLPAASSHDYGSRHLLANGASSTEEQKLAAITEFEGRIAIVTGGSRGIGAAAAKGLAQAGAAVMISARNGNAAAQAADEIIAVGGQAFGVACDIADWSAAEAMVDETVQRFGPPDILVNNAGIIEPIGALAQSDPVSWGRNVSINLIGAYNVTRAVLPHML